MSEALRQDLKYALRTLRRSPGFTITAVLLTALGVGATTAAFAVADHVLLRPLPYREPDRLVRFSQQYLAGDTGQISPANFRDLIAGAPSLEAASAFTGQSANVSGSGTPVRLEGQLVSGNLFELLGRSALAGVTFSKADEAATASTVVVLSHRAWTTHFGADPSLVGKTLTMNGVPRTVAGIMPPDFMFPDRAAEFWMPLQLDPAQIENRANTILGGVGRLRDGSTLAQADAELDAVAAELARRFPNENRNLSVLTLGLRGDLTRANRTMVAAVGGAAVCLLLIAATNLAGLLLSRGLARRRELAVRAALGAERRRLIRQLLTESALVAIAGAALGAAFATGGTRLLSRLVPTSLPIADTPSIDWRFAAVAAVAALVTVLTCSALPARRTAAGAAPDALRESQRTGSSRRTERLQSALVVAQVAISVVLLVSGGLLGRALWKIQARDPGFQPGGAITMRTSLPWPKYAAASARVAFYDRVLSDIRALPGVEAAGYVTGLPMLVPGLVGSVTPEGAPPSGRRENLAAVRFATGGYFDAMGIPLLAGRSIAATDTRDAPFVAVISESLARKHWPGANPLGRRFTFMAAQRTVIGVVGDVRTRGLERTSEPQVYLPPGQVDDGALVNHTPKDLVVRSAATAPALLPAIRRIVSNADPELPIANVRALEEIVDEQTAPRAVQVRVLAGFAGIAVLVASVGLYGLLAFGVSRRHREIGLRMALGATPRAILALVVGHGARLAACGLVIGAAGAYGAGRWMQSLLAGVSPHDATVFAAATALTLTLALAGMLLPALRAARLSPLEATRD